MKFIPIFILFVFLSTGVFGQHPDNKDSIRQVTKQGTIVLTNNNTPAGYEMLDSITMKKRFLTTSYYYNNEKLSYLDLKKIILTNPETHNYVRLANVNRIWGNVLLGSGTIAIAYGLLQYPDTKNQDIVIKSLIVGGSFILLSVPMQFGYSKNIRKATATYNNGLKKFSYYNFGINLKLSTNGFGLVFSF